MGELRAPKRVSSSARRRGEQGRLSIAVVDDEAPSTNAGRVPSGDRAAGFRRPAKKADPTSGDDRPKTPAPVFHPLAYRGVVAEWSLEDRERWGRRANELEETGLAWRDAETQAFVEVWFHLHRSNATADVAPTASEAPDEADEVEDDRA